MSERIAVFGASRGFGAAFVKASAGKFSGADWLLVSRKEKLLSELATELGSGAVVMAADFSKPEDQAKCFEKIRSFEPTRVFYFAGGGPFGPYQERDLKDHRWAWEVTFAFPAALIHQLLRMASQTRQAVFVGSAIAEDSPDPGAASYSAAKHALRGLIRSVRAEKPALDLRLYSPGYMDTDLLPPHAWPRQQGLVMEPGRAAQDLLSWIFANDDAGFRIYKDQK